MIDQSKIDSRYIPLASEDLGRFTDPGPWFIGQRIIANGEGVIVMEPPEVVQDHIVQLGHGETTGNWYLIQSALS